MTDSELVSRWMAGDLSAEDAHALRARIDAEPEVRAIWQAFQAMDADFDRLPTDSPPPGLDAEVLRRLQAPPVPSDPVPERPRRAGTIAWVALGMAAGVLLSLGARLVTVEPTQTLQLESGTVTVEGDQVVAAGPARVHVDGRAQLSATPRWVEVHVLDGRARVESDLGVTWIYSGETRRVGDAGRPGRPAPPPAISEDLEELRGEIAVLREQSATDQKMLDAAKGRLALLEGTPQSWPSDVVDALRPKAFAAHAADVASRLDGFRVTDVICDEYPCIAVFAGPPKTAAAQVDALIEAMQEGAPEGADRWQTRAERVDDARGPDLLVLALSVANGPAAPDLDARVKYRLEGEIQSALEDIP
jgi:hypothetical protein